MAAPPCIQTFVTPRISLAGARAAYVGPGLDLSPHRNVAATIAIALGPPFTLEMPAGAAVAETTMAALIPPNTHTYLVAAGPMAFVFLDAWSDDLRRVRSVDLHAAQARLVSDGLARVAEWDVIQLCDALGIAPRRIWDARIGTALRALEARPQDFHSVDELAAMVELSPSRFQALFSKEVGVPFRRYRMWRRMAAVMKAIKEGRSLTDAAYDAGFASSAHLSTTFREMFGLTPSRLVALGVDIRFANQESAIAGQDKRPASLLPVERRAACSTGDV
jgi:AraC-like DNA-binding protein